MAAEWLDRDFDVLTSELGALIAAGDDARVAATGRRAIEQAIAEAAVAVAQAIAVEPESVGRARQAIDTAGQVIAALDESVAQARQLRSRGATLSQRARELVDKARR